MNQLRDFLRTNATAVIEAFDAHEATINDDGTYRCNACKHDLAQADWELHLMDAISDRLVGAQLELVTA